MEDASEAAVTLLRDIANKIEQGEVALRRAEHRYGYGEISLNITVLALAGKEARRG